MTNKLYIRKDIGKGNPLVLLHGMFADGSQWNEIALLLSSDYRVIVVDLLGHGRSPRPKKATYSDTEHVAALRSTLESLKATKNTTVVGYSMGGAVALAYSSTYPESVEQLYLISTPYYLKPDEMIPAQYSSSLLISKATTTLFQGVEKLMGRQNLANRIADFGNNSKKFHAMIGANENKLDPEIVRKNLDKLVREFDFVKHLKSLKVPLTFYVGKKDVFVIQGQLDALRQYQPNMEIQRLDIMKIDHMLVQNLPNEMSRLIRKNKKGLLHVGFDKGKGETLILLHGIESSTDYWKPLLPAIQKGRRVVAIDLLGFGDSPKPLNISYSLDDHAEWLGRTLDSLKIKSFSIMGHSLGALVALNYASKNPGPISKLILFSPVFVPEGSSGSPMQQRLHMVDKLTEASTTYSRTAKSLGQKRITQYIPLIRSVKNAVQNQNTAKMTKNLSKMPMSILYGAHDNLIDKEYLKKVAKRLKSTKIVEISNAGHNFPFFDPETTLNNLDGFKMSAKRPVTRAGALPRTFLQQLAKLATPVLISKSLLFILTGVLLFTDLASWVITLGLGIYVFKMGYSIIRGAFSLKNENLSYLGYILLGISGIAASYFLVFHPDISLKISVLTVCGLIFLSGLSRVLVGLFWTSKKPLRRRLLLIGVVMMIVGVSAIAGSLFSVKVVVYSFAVLSLFKGMQFGFYALGALILAYIRGFKIKAADTA